MLEDKVGDVLLESAPTPCLRSHSSLSCSTRWTWRSKCSAFTSTWRSLGCQQGHWIAVGYDMGLRKTRPNEMLRYQVASQVARHREAASNTGPFCVLTGRARSMHSLLCRVLQVLLRLV
jgi:hypothetical protein